jgi:hypothetical protein
MPNKVKRGSWCPTCARLTRRSPRPSSGTEPAGRSGDKQHGAAVAKNVSPVAKKIRRGAWLPPHLPKAGVPSRINRDARESR